MYRFALIGESLSHSYSPMIHSKFGDYKYELCEVEKENLRELLNSGLYDGFNVTIPYKEEIMKYCDEISNDSRRIGCVNTIVKNSTGGYDGYNTDYFGFRYLLENSEIDVAGRKCLILGSGGSSKTVKVVLEDLGANEILIVSRTGELNYENVTEESDAEIIINTTPVGMFPNNLKTLLNLDDFPKCRGVVDLIYNPNRTQFILDAMERGIPCVSGLGMLVAQAFKASEIFQKKDLNYEEISVAIEEIRSSMLNKILIGMPGAGKTFLGSKMTEASGREFVDINKVRLAVEPGLVGDLGDTLIRPQQQVYAFVDPVGHEIAKERLPDCFLKEAAAFASAEADEGGNVSKADTIRIVGVYEAKYFFQALAVFVCRLFPGPLRQTLQRILPD